MMAFSRRRWRLVLWGVALGLIAVATAVAGKGWGRPTGERVSAAITPVAPTVTPLDTAAPPPSTNTPTITLTPSPGPSPTPSRTPTRTPIPTATYTPSTTPTGVPLTIEPPANFVPTVRPGASPSATPPTAVPSPVPTFEVDNAITNILLLGSDQADPNSHTNRTDTMIIVSINSETRTAAMISLPRDLLVYIPGWTMNRLNTAGPHATAIAYPGGDVRLLKDTILYNFGVTIHYYARVDFAGFKQVVDAMGGVEVVVSCPLTDWRLKSPELAPAVEENWEQFTLEQGIHHLDGDLALWYARSRRSTNDFDRGRRQQQLLRAMLNQGVDLNLLPQIPTLWETYRDSVETDLDIGRILQLAALAPAVRENGVQNLYVVPNKDVISWTVPETNAAVQLPVWEELQDNFQRLFLPPALNRATRPPLVVEVINGTTNPDLGRLAAENLAWHGFAPVLGTADRQDYATTTLTYYGSSLKGSYDWLIGWIINRPVELVSDAPYEYDYRVVLGADYNPCRPELFAPQINLEP